MATFNNLDSLFKHLEKQARSVLKNEIATETVRTMQEKIQEEVYDVYDPKVYVRQGYNGGLIDQDNIEVSMVDDNTLSVENIRFDGDREVAQIIETGRGYDYSFEYSGVLRPFTEETRKEMRNGKAQNLMKQGLVKRGLTVKNTL